MPIDLNKLEQAKQAALSKGYSQEEVDAYAQTVTAKQEKQSKYIQDAAEAVRRGYPGESIPAEYRLDVYSQLSDAGYNEPFTAAGRAAGVKEEEEKEDVLQEIGVYGASGKTFGDWDDLSLDAKDMLIGLDIEVPKALTETEKIKETEFAKADAEKQNVANQVKRKAQNVLDVINKYSGVIKGEQALAEYEYVVGDYNKYVFDEAGKQFPAAEKAMVAGSLITVEEAAKQNIWQRITGDVPEPTAKVMDSIGKVKAKLGIGIKIANQVLGVSGDEKRGPGLDLGQQPTPQPTPTQQPTQQAGTGDLRGMANPLMLSQQTTQQQPSQRPGLFTTEMKEKGVDVLNKVADYAPAVMGATAGFFGSLVGTPVLGAVSAGAGYGAGKVVEETVESLTGRQDETHMERYKAMKEEPIIAGATDYIVGKVFNWAAGTKAGKKITKVLTQKLAGITRKVWREYAESTGDDLIESSAKWFKQSSSWDDLIGTTKNQFSDGIMHTARDEAEVIIQKAVAESGDEIIVSFDVFEQIVREKTESLGAVGGNEAKIEAIEEVLKKTRQLYEDGLTAENLLNVKRAGDSKWGARVANPSTRESAANYTQKEFANIARNILHNNFDDISDALNLEHEILELIPIFKDQVAAEAIAKNLLPSARGSGAVGMAKSVLESKAVAKSLGIGLDIGESFVGPYAASQVNKKEEDLSGSPGFMYR